MFSFSLLQCPPWKQMHLLKQFFLTILLVEVLLLSAKTTNGSIFVFYSLLSWGNFFSCQKKSVANALVVFGLFLFVFIFCQLCCFDVSCCDFDFEGGKYNRKKTQLQNKRQIVRLGPILFSSSEIWSFTLASLPFFVN